MRRRSKTIGLEDKTLSEGKEEEVKDGRPERAETQTLPSL